MGILLLTGLFVLPWLLQYSAQYVALIRWLSPAFWCYALGIALAQIIHIPHDVFEPIMEYTVALAIPLLLFSGDVRSLRHMLGDNLKAYLLYVPIVLGGSLLSFSLFQGWSEASYAAAMAGSVYIGGTANMAAVQVAIGAPTTLFGVLNLADLVVSATWLLLVLSLGQRIWRLFLPAFPNSTTSTIKVAVENAPWHKSPMRQRIKWIGLSMGAALLALGMAASVTFLVMGQLDGIVMLIALTLTGVAGAFWPRIQQLPGSYETGDYLFLVFCAIAGSLVDLDALLAAGEQYIGFMAVIVGSTIVLHSLLAALLRIDTDTVLITHAAGICGPPFIGPVANALGNRAIVVPGMMMGILNLAVGNLMGVLIYGWIG